MSGKAGEATVANNTEQKHALGKSANACANKFLADLRGHRVLVTVPGGATRYGELVEFDLYAMVIRIIQSEDEDGVSDALVFKGPGVTVEADTSSFWTAESK